ncbi:hypothetical protein ACTHGU_07395 [Chitinophagaceae bacterium MMS25-I14]
MTERDEVLLRILATEAAPFYQDATIDDIADAPGMEQHIDRASDLATPLNLPATTTGKDFKPNSRTNIIILVLFLLPFVWCAYMAFAGKGNTTYFTLLTLFYALLSAGMLYRIYMSRSLRFTIRTDREGITIAGTRSRWADVYDVAVMLLPSQRGGAHFLIVAMKDGSYHKYDLRMFGKRFRGELASYVEYFRKGA